LYDFIGDIHGYADELESLLTKLGYTTQDGVYSHPSRKVIFAGDYIDRGPQIRETLQIVKDMADKGSALALMGNHEFNAILYHLPDNKGGYLREHSEKNTQQHSATLAQFKEHLEEWQVYLDWFMRLPLFMETPDFRVVHACWDQNNIAYLRNVLGGERLSAEVLYQYWEKDQRFDDAIEQTLKGKELKLSEEHAFTDKDGHQRQELRIRWWDNPKGFTYKEYSVELMENLPNDTIHEQLIADATWYLETEKPVFFGHYWLKGNISLFRHNVCCLDYSVAKKGHLVAYRWEGEQTLDPAKLISVESRPH
jgi:hypothetical protein